MEKHPGSDQEKALREEQDRLAQAETQAAVMELETGGGGVEPRETLVVGEGTPAYEAPGPESKQRPTLRRSTVPPVKDVPPEQATEVKGSKPAAVKARAKKNQELQVEVQDTVVAEGKERNTSKDKADKAKDDAKTGAGNGTKVAPKKAKHADSTRNEQVKEHEKAEAKKRAKKPQEPRDPKEFKDKGEGQKHGKTKGGQPEKVEMGMGMNG